MPMFWRSSIVLFAAYGLLLTSPASAQTEAVRATSDLTARLNSIEKTFDAKRSELHVAGAALAIVSDDTIIYSKGFGFRDVEKRLPVTPHTVFAIGSVTKSFTALAALLSQEQGLVSLTDSPRKYLPYFKLQDTELDTHVTLADMLSHRTGLIAYNDLPWLTGVLRPDEVIRTLANARPTAKRGDKFQYNNVMFLAAGECIAAAQGSPYPNVIKRLIFDPLGMRESNLSIRAMQRSPDHATGYDLPDKEGPPRPLPLRDLRNIAPAGAVNSNITDMAQWIRLMLGRGAINGKRLISEQSFRELVSPQMSAGGDRSYGYGWVLDTWHGHRQIWHSGGIDGFEAHVAMLPDQHVGFVLLTNSSDLDLSAATVDAVFTHLVGAANTSLAPPKSSVAADSDMEREAGKYEVTRGAAVLEMTAAFRQKQLFLQPKGQPEFAMTLIGDHRYTLAPPAPPNIFISFRPQKADPGRFELIFEYNGETLFGARAGEKPFSLLLTIEQLMQQVIAARGGEAALRVHRTLQTVMTLTMENQGITGEVRRYWERPDNTAEVTEYRAVGRNIGRTHIFFDGTGGRTESTFAAPEIRSGKALTDGRLLAAFATELDWKSVFKTVVIERTDKVGAEDVYVVRKTPDKGSDIVDYISTRTFLLLKRESPGDITETFRQYQKVGDVLLPFEIDRDDSNGRTVLKLKHARFDMDISRDLFHPGYRKCRL